MSEGADPQDGLALQKRYESLKPRVIRPLGEDWVFILRTMTTEH